MKAAKSVQLRKVPAKSRSGNLNQEPVAVYCRIRPIIYETPCVKAISSTTVSFSPPESARNGKELQYTFKRVFDANSNQSEVFNDVALHLVKELVSGKNGLLFTYGVTGSGKTFTMTGTSQGPGIMPRCLEVLFKTIGDRQAKKYLFKPDRANGFEMQDEEEADLAARNEQLGYMKPKTPKTPRRKEPDTEFVFSNDSDSCSAVSFDDENLYSCFVSYVEIYNNNVYDLLDATEEAITKKLQSKQIREDRGLTYVHDVMEVEVKTPEDAFAVFSRGLRRKRTARTLLNEESSRSHSVFTIRLVQAPIDAVEGALDEVEGREKRKQLMTVSQLSLVDLAGSERANRTKNTGQNLKEAGNINNSLMTLRTCLEILRENQVTGGTKLIPYRECKLTQLFKSYFDGEGAVKMIVCVNPRADDYDETAHVLKFAELTQEVQVTRPTPYRQDLGVTPGRRRAQLFRRGSDDDILDTPYRPMAIASIGSWPSLVMTGPNDTDTLKALENYLMSRETEKSSLLAKLKRDEEALRLELFRQGTELVAFGEDNAGLKRLLDQERARSAECENKLGAISSERNVLLQKLADREALIRNLESKQEEKDLIIRRQGAEKEKVKEKLHHHDKKLEKKITETSEFWREEVRIKDQKLQKLKEVLSDVPNIALRPRRAEYPLTPRTVNTAGTLYQPPSTITSARGPAVCNPRHRRSRSAGGGDRWLDHRPAQPVELSTVLQPQMRKRKSITKLTDMKDVVDPKTSKYCLTTQEQDTDGELETKLYKGDVIPTCSGGAQVILHDVETLKQSSPTKTPCRKRNIPDEETENRCSIALEGHGKRSRN